MSRAGVKNTFHNVWDNLCCCICKKKQQRSAFVMPEEWDPLFYNNLVVKVTTWQVEDSKSYSSIAWEDALPSC